jgi:phage FluMu protein Com
MILTGRATRAVAAGLEEKPWSLEQVVEMTQAYFSEASGGLGLAKSKSFVHSANKTMFFDNLPLEITCLKCGKLIKETVNWLKAESRKCPFCDTPIDTTEFRRGIDEATNRTHKMLRNLQGSLKSVKINIKL